MKKILWIIIFSICSSVYAQSNEKISNDLCETESLLNAITCGQYYGRIKTLYYTTDNAYFNNFNQENTSMGGMLKYSTQTYKGMSLGISYNFIRTMSGNSIDEGGIAELAENKDGVGEAYLSYQLNKLNFKVGKQTLDIPFIGHYDYRIAPPLYRALDIFYGNQDNYIRLTGINGFQSYMDDQIKKSTTYDNDIYIERAYSLGGLTTTKFSDYSLKSQFWIQNYANISNLAYTEFNLNFDDQGFKPNIGIQAIYSKNTGDNLKGNINSLSYGTQLRFKPSENTSVKFGYNHIKSNEFSRNNGALYAPYMNDVTSSPYYAAPYFTVLEAYGSGNAYSLSSDVNVTQNLKSGIQLSYLKTKKYYEEKDNILLEYLYYINYNFDNFAKGLNLAYIGGMQTMPSADNFYQSRIEFSYIF